LAWVLQESFEQSEYQVARIARRGALFWLDRWDSETRRRDQLPDSFTPRRRGSIWSAINIKRAGELTKEKRMRPAGLKVFAARIENKSGIYSYEQRPVELPEQYAKPLKKNKAAWNFFQAQPPSYRKLMSWYIVSAKKKETRLQRVNKLTNASAERKRL
jgi:uncharacterized protein YdeI (YjbR/CyaY-like superfamily)